MKIKCSDILAKADNLKPNVYTQKLKRSWLNTLEVRIREFTSKYGEEVFDDAFLTEEKPVLRLSSEKSDIYLFYIMAMIDLANQDINMYNNNTVMFENLLENFQKDYRRRNIPQKSTSVKY